MALLKRPIRLSGIMERDQTVTVPYLAKIAGVTEETLWRNVRELLAVVEEEPLEGASK
jgi:hypothetical protein